MLWADNSEQMPVWVTILLVTCTTVIAPSAVWLARLWRDRNREQAELRQGETATARKERIEDEKTEFMRQGDLLQRVDAENQAIKKEIELMRREHRRDIEAMVRENTFLRVECTRAVDWIKHLEDRLRDAKVNFRPWVDSAPTGTGEMTKMEAK